MPLGSRALLSFSSASLRYHLPRSRGRVARGNFRKWRTVDTTIRRVGDYAKKPPGDMHMEQGGPDGALVLFELYAPDGQLTEQLDKKGTHCAPWQPISCDAFSKNSGQQPENADATDSRAIVGRRRPLIFMTQGGSGEAMKTIHLKRRCRRSDTDLNS